MTSADSYRRMAAELRARAVNAPSTRLATEWDNLARCYLRLAGQADQNDRFDLAVEVGPLTIFKGGGA